MVTPGVQFKLEAVGWVCPAGHRVKNDEPVVPVTVTFNTTASASAGTPPTPPTVTSRFCPPVHGVAYGPTCHGGGRESSTRDGASAVKPSPGMAS